MATQDGLFGADGFDTHLYTWMGTDTMFYRWFGKSVASNNMYRTWAVPVSTLDFGGDKTFSSVTMRLKIATRSSTSMSLRYTLRLWDADNADSANLAYNSGAVQYPTTHGTDGEYEVLNTDWKTLDLSSYSISDAFGFLSFGSGPVACSDEFLILGVEIGLK
jgi:hypothetical protein